MVVWSSVKGQVTIEFILILIIMLTILATISIPLVNSLTDTVTDTSVAVNLGSSVQRIVHAAQDVHLAGCGSFKNVTVYIEPDPLAESTIYFDNNYVWANYTQLDGEEKKIAPLAYPDYIKLTASCGDTDHTYWVVVEKDCDDDRHSPVLDEVEKQVAYIGYECEA